MKTITEKIIIVMMILKDPKKIQKLWELFKGVKYM
jgi:hypothetical protein